MDLIGRASSMEIQQKHIPQLRFPGFLNDGEWVEKKYEDCLDYEQPQSYLVSSENYKKTGVPVLTAGKTFILGFTDETFGVYTKLPVIIFDDFTTDSRFVNFPFKAKSSAMKMLSVKEGYDLRFVFATMQNNEFRPHDHQRHWISIYSKFKVKIPSLAEQQHIATCLTAADEMIASANDKLEQLKTFKKGLMQKLFPARGKTVPELRFKEFEKDGEWEEKKYEDCLDYEQPQSYLVSSENYKKTGIPVLTAGKTFILGFTDETFGIYTKLPVIIFDDFTTDSRFVDFPFKAKSSALKMLSVKEGYDLRFIFATMQNNEFKPHDHQRHWISIYSKFKVTIPSLAEQHKIAGCLASIGDMINHYTNKITLLEQYKKGLMQQMFPTSK